MEETLAGTISPLRSTSALLERSSSPGQQQHHPRGDRGRDRDDQSGQHWIRRRPMFGVSHTANVMAAHPRCIYLGPSPQR